MALLKDYAYYIDRGRLALIEKSTTSGDWETISTSGKTVRIFTKGLPSKLTTETTLVSSISSQIPEQYHEAILNLAIATGYTVPPNLNGELFQLFKGLYQGDLNRAKKFSKMNRRSTGFIRPQEF